MRLRNTIIALVLLAIVGGYAFIVGRYSVPEAPQRLIDVKQDDIAKIELRYADRDIVLKLSSSARRTRLATTRESP